MSRLPDELDPQDPEDYLAFNEDIALACVEMVRNYKQRKEIHKKIDAQIVGHHNPQRKPITFSAERQFRIHFRYLNVLEICVQATM